MANFRNAIPASFRRPAEKSKFAYGLTAYSGRMTMMDGSVVGAAGKSRFAPMPQEPEDAKMTGVTRSLTRRLLGLNIPKVMVVSKTLA